MQAISALAKNDQAVERRAETVLSLFETCDALRKPERFETLLAVAVVVEPSLAAAQGPTLQTWLALTLAVDAGAAARSASAPEQIKQVVRAARLQALHGA